MLGSWHGVNGRKKVVNPCSNMSGTRIMDQKPHFAQKSKNCRKAWVSH